MTSFHKKPNRLRAIDRSSTTSPATARLQNTTLALRESSTVRLWGKLVPLRGAAHKVSSPLLNTPSDHADLVRSRVRHGPWCTYERKVSKVLPQEMFHGDALIGLVP